NGLNETGMRLRMLKCIGGFDHFTGFGIDKIMPLCRPGESIGIMEPCVKPLRRIRRGHLMREHVTKLIMKSISIFRRLEVAKVLPPIGPAAGEPSKYLSGIMLSSQLQFAIRSDDRISLLISLRHSGFSKIFLGENINRELRPGLGNVDIF